MPSPEEWMIVRAAWRAAAGAARFPGREARLDAAAPHARRRARRPPEQYAGLVSSRSRGPIISSGCACIGRRGLPWVAHFSDPWVDSPYATAASARRSGGGWRRTSSAKRRAVVFVTERDRRSRDEEVSRRVAAQGLRRAARVRAGAPRRVRRATADRTGPMRHRLHRPVLRRACGHRSRCCRRWRGLHAREPLDGRARTCRSSARTPRNTRARPRGSGVSDLVRFRRSCARRPKPRAARGRRGRAARHRRAEPRVRARFCRAS